MKLLIITQKVDEDDDLLGFFVDWIREFAKHFDQIHVITLARGRFGLPNNVFVHSLGKELGRSKLLQLVKFYLLLFKLVPLSDRVFAHMSPIFVIASWPVAFMFGKRMILWYLHRSVTIRLKIAERLCYKIVTATKESLMFKSKKIIEVGHGINVQRFRMDRNWELISQGSPKILSVGRISEIKDYPTLIRAIAILKNKFPSIKLQIIGRPVMKPDFQTFESSRQLINELDLQMNVELVGFVPYSQIKPYYNNNHININLTPTGGIDKSVLEGMAVGQLTLTSNSAFAKYFGPHSNRLIFEHGNPANLAKKITDLINSSTENKKDISEFLIESVSQHHNLKDLTIKIFQLYE